MSEVRRAMTQSGTSASEREIERQKRSNSNAVHQYEAFASHRRQLTDLLMARPEAGVTPSKTPSPKPKARQADTKATTASATTNSGENRTDRRVAGGIQSPRSTRPG